MKYEMGGVSVRTGTQMNGTVGTPEKDPSIHVFTI